VAVVVDTIQVVGVVLVDMSQEHLQLQVTLLIQSQLVVVELVAHQQAPAEHGVLQEILALLQVQILYLLLQQVAVVGVNIIF